MKVKICEICKSMMHTVTVDPNLFGAVQWDSSIEIFLCLQCPSICNSDISYNSPSGCSPITVRKFKQLIEDTLQGHICNFNKVDRSGEVFLPSAFSSSPRPAGREFHISTVHDSLSEFIEKLPPPTRRKPKPSKFDPRLCSICQDPWEYCKCEEEPKP